MSQFNVFERKVAHLMSRFPRVKHFLKMFYSRISYAKNRKNYRKSSVKEVESFENNGAETFFGYFDKSPTNFFNNALLYSTTASTAQKPPKDEEIILSVYFVPSQAPLLSIPVRAFNWQQGARAHWLDSDLFIFNDFEESSGGYVARVWSMSEKKQVKKFSLPVQDSFQTEYFISLNYRRLQELRPDYGYRNLPPLSRADLDQLDNDGLWIVDFETGSTKLFVSLAFLKSIEPTPEMENALHKVNHVMISPNGRSFIFMHRFINSGGRTDRLFLANVESGCLKMLADFGMVSHCFWVDDKTVFGYLRGPGKKDGYWLVNVSSGEFTSFGDGKLDRYGDGHPHVYGDWFVTDTYPDKARMQHLLLGNLKTGEVKEIGEFFHGFDYEGESRCDLHPRFSLDGKSVFFDSVFSGKRRLYKMDLE